MTWRPGRDTSSRTLRSLLATISAATYTSPSSTSQMSCVQAHECLGIHNVMWSSDYPHPVSSWPNSRSTVERIFAGVSEDDRDLVCYANAARVWNL